MTAIGFKEPPFPLCSLPDPALDKVLLFLSYHEIAQLRQVNKQFNVICKSLLNKGFRALKRFHSKLLKEIRSKTPILVLIKPPIDRTLWQQKFILVHIGSNISSLESTFMKYVNDGICCFIPGMVLDEMYGVFRNIKIFANPSAILQLKDLCTMAEEHFIDHIEPSLFIPLKQQDDPTNKIIRLTKMNKRMNKRMKQQNKDFKATEAKMNKMIQEQFKNFKATMTKVNKKIDNQDEVIAEQNKKIKNQDEFIAQQNIKLEDFSKETEGLVSKKKWDSEKMEGTRKLGDFSWTSEKEETVSINANAKRDAGTMEGNQSDAVARKMKYGKMDMEI